MPSSRDGVIHSPGICQESYCRAGASPARGKRGRSFFNDEIRMTNDERNPKPECRRGKGRDQRQFGLRAWSFLPHSSFGFRHCFRAGRARRSFFNDEIRMTNDERNPKPRMSKGEGSGSAPIRLRLVLQPREMREPGCAARQASTSRLSVARLVHRTMKVHSSSAPIALRVLCELCGSSFR